MTGLNKNELRSDLIDFDAGTDESIPVVPKKKEGHMMLLDGVVNYTKRQMERNFPNRFPRVESSHRSPSQNEGISLDRKIRWDDLPEGVLTGDESKSFIYLHNFISAQRELGNRVRKVQMKTYTELKKKIDEHKSARVTRDDLKDLFPNV